MICGPQFPLWPSGCVAHMGGWKLDWPLYLRMALFACLSSKTLVVQPTNWEAFKLRHWVKHTPWWYHPLAIFSPQSASIVTETEITALL